MAYLLSMTLIVSCRGISRKIPKSNFIFAWKCNQVFRGAKKLFQKRGYIARGPRKVFLSCLECTLLFFMLWKLWKRPRDRPCGFPCRINYHESRKSISPESGMVRLFRLIAGFGKELFLFFSSSPGNKIGCVLVSGLKKIAKNLVKFGFKKGISPKKQANWAVKNRASSIEIWFCRNPAKDFLRNKKIVKPLEDRIALLERDVQRDLHYRIV